MNEESGSKRPILGLAIGRIVHYNLHGEHVPAIITRVIDQSSGTVMLTMFAPNRAPAPLFPAVEHDPFTIKPGTWHFPEFVP